MDALCHLSTASATYPHFSPQLSTVETVKRQDGQAARWLDGKEERYRGGKMTVMASSFTP